MDRKTETRRSMKGEQKDKQTSLHKRFTHQQIGVRPSLSCQASDFCPKKWPKDGSNGPRIGILNIVSIR
jgi:hypothetical protein